MRIVEVIADVRYAKTLAGMARFYGAADFWWGGSDPTGRDGRCSIRMLVPDDHRQALIDSLLDLFKADARARIVIQPLDAMMTREGPAGQESDDQRRQEQENEKEVTVTREELYVKIARGAQLDSDFLLLTVLSTLVAAIGLVENDVAVVIGAMVIAPLLGPNIALAFATSLGDRALTWRAFKTDVAGLGLALALAVAITLLLPLDLDSPAILARTEVGLGSVVLGLAAGTAAVLSLSTGVASTLVGVMVAVALLPPTAAMGMMLGAGRWEAASGAFLLLSVNIVCVLLAAKLVFLVKGVRPRSWTERNRAKQSMAFYLSLWGLMLTILTGLILLRSKGWHLPG